MVLRESEHILIHRAGVLESRDVVLEGKDASIENLYAGIIEKGMYFRQNEQLWQQSEKFACITI